MTDKPAKPASKRSRSTRRVETKQRMPNHGEIAERAYFIHLDEGVGDQLENWLRAERELTSA